MNWQIKKTSTSNIIISYISKIKGKNIAYAGWIQPM